jgi:hypothetical protein
MNNLKLITTALVQMLEADGDAAYLRFGPTSWYEHMGASWEKVPSQEEEELEEKFQIQFGELIE